MHIGGSFVVGSDIALPIDSTKNALRPRPWVVVVLVAWAAYTVYKNFSPPPRLAAPGPVPAATTPQPQATSAAESTPVPLPAATLQTLATPTPAPTRPAATRPPAYRIDTSVAASNLPLRLPGPALKPAAKHPRIALLKGKIQRARILAAYRELAEIYVGLGLYAEAAATYREEAAEYRKKKLNDAAIIEELKASRYDTDVRLYLDREPTLQELKTLYTRAPAEPEVGCYLGIHTRSSDAELMRAVGKQHGSAFIYRHYGDPVPTKWILECKKLGIIPQLAWEPSSLNVVKNDEYLNNFARECGRLEWPVFIRFASEMNGFWTPWHGNPKLYREKFRIVHKAFRRHAPRVATIWCVNNPPLGNVQDYYPGDDGCDWVGVNFYNVMFHDNKLSRPGFEDNPLALLDPIYKMYAHKKPIAICEYAASHRAAVDKVTRPNFAVHKMSMLYSALPRLYPRVKLIDWFDINTMENPIPGKTHNDYRIAPQPAVRQAYRRLVVSPYFLSGVRRLGDPKTQLPRPIVPGQRVRGVARFSVLSSLTLTNTRVYVKLGQKIIYASDRPGAHEVNFDLARFSPGPQTVTVYVYDNRNRFVRSAMTTITVVR